MAYTPTTWVDGASGGTPITAAELNRMESGIVDGQNAANPTVDTLTGATAVGKSVMKAADAAAARTAIGAGTSNVKVGTGAGDALAGNTALLKVGTTATTAKAGDYVPAWADVTGKSTIPAATAAGTRAQLDAGTDTTVRAFSAKDIAEFVAAQIAAIPEA